MHDSSSIFAISSTDSRALRRLTLPCFGSLFASATGIPPPHKSSRAPTCCASLQVRYCVRALIWVVFCRQTLTHFRPSISLANRWGWGKKQKPSILPATTKCSELRCGLGPGDA
ncbi:uncharacterized protein LOC114184204 isoform X2 [Vigna unguiculata]|uniref:uncharacterized protein LOC114184204 isoform X2 n=1 Tax=Vigna unguiculata TaxID=3917 RepID=UPI0010164B7A|nr:uncharacterized protein LOC114184204 isoform X2 [Vigna unguiculata]